MLRQLSRGFTLIEVLVSLVILTFGLLGIAGLMAKGQRVAFEAYQRQQAVALASDMAERIRSNRLLAVTCPAAFAGCTSYTAGAPITAPLGTGGLYNDYRLSLIKDCAAQPCNLQELALFDLGMWDGLLQGYSEQQTGSNARVGGIVHALGCIQNISTNGVCPPPPATAALFSQTIRITVAWQGNDDTSAPTASACGTNQYGSETKRRVVTYDLLVTQPCP